MIDMNKEIIFRDGWSLDGLPFDDWLRARALRVIELGYEYGLVLDRFYIESDMIHFDWRGTKKALSDWYRYYSCTMTYESEERRNKALETIANK